MEKLKSYKDLEVWKVSMDFVIDIYRITSTFPTAEKFGLTNQIRRSAVSIPSNMAEGSGRRNTREFIQFLYISNGSLSELETQLEIAFRLNYIKDYDSIVLKIMHIRKMLINLIHALNKKLTV
ncbi:MAG: four helix bundle protein [Bacteroidales bacterium]|jgi:four helix bundle protein|nr:four helix bundle protein [Bacteroidales bacterium]